MFSGAYADAPRWATAVTVAAKAALAGAAGARRVRDREVMVRTASRWNMSLLWWEEMTTRR
ncbi:hypothetical protein GCM10020001_019280 [Nonomuraea salmonea]